MTSDNFEQQLAKYADLVINTGLTVESNDIVSLTIEIDQAQFAHLLIEKAYQAGAQKVIIQWQDSDLTKLELTYQTSTELQKIWPHEESLRQYIADKQVKRLVVMSNDPDNLKNLAADKIAASQNRDSAGFRAVRTATQNNLLSWVIVAAASPAWAHKVFPKETSEMATTHLWQAIFAATRVDQENPTLAWQQHRDNLTYRADKLNDYQFDSLHYQAPGTDLIIGLPENHFWEAAGAKNARGQFFIPNMPTEEVFTAPDRNRVNGYISTTKPLSYAGTILENMVFTFKHGKVIKATAEKGQATLSHLLKTDNGSKYLGEVALVPDATPISQSGITFFNTLFDENASDHLALGAAYPFSVQNGTTMTELELQKAGLNSSQIHVDFMVGSSKMVIDGVTKDGTIVPLFRDGNWIK